MKYIFVTGAPGSKLDLVSNSIYRSPSINQSDNTSAREYWHDASGKLELASVGTHFGPGMEFGNFFDNIEYYNTTQCEEEFDKPFTNKKGVKIIKSHVFCHKIDFLKKYWPDSPIIMVHRNNDSCLGWWIKSGEFNITYPKYYQYYVNLKEMSSHIGRQNADLLNSWHNYDGKEPVSNVELTEILQLAVPALNHLQNYQVHDIKVKVI